MERIPETSPATLDGEILEAAVDAAEKRALEAAGKEELPVRDVQDLQRQELHALLYGDAQGSDGSSATENTMELPTEAEAALSEDHAERMQAVDAAPDAYVFRRTDATVGVQHDDDRSIGIADEALSDAETTKRIATHEAEHRAQEEGDAVASLPETGNPTIDRVRTRFRRLIFREHGAIEAEGGLKDHTPEYHEYSDVASATKEYLNGAGMNGTELVRWAGERRDGFQKLAGAMVSASIRRRLQEQGVVAMSA